MFGESSQPVAVVSVGRRHAGRPSSWRLFVRGGVHLLCLVPLLTFATWGLLGDLGANPIEALVRGLGDWALRFVVLVLAVTPVRRLTGWSVLAGYRRMVGLWAFAYAGFHVASYVVLDQFFDWANIGHEILQHKFITVGMVALSLMVPLAVTSTNAMVRRLGARRWRRMHRVVYVVGPLAVIHYAWMVKADITQPLVYAAVIAVLLGCRGVMLLWEGRAAPSDQ